MNTSRDTAPARICLLALPETTPTSIYGLHEIFSAVGVAWREITGEEVDVRRLETRIVARQADAFPSSLGVPIAPHAALEDTGRADVVIVTDLALAPEESPRGKWREEAAWVREQSRQGATICSVCTGSVFLAEAGLLDGVEATSHWGVTRIFAAHYPQVKLHPDRILCPAGPEHRIVTGGGAGTWTDLALYLIARFCGTAEAVRIAKVFVLGDRSEGQLPFASMRKVPSHQDAVIGRCQEWLADHYTEANPVARMAALSGLPERTFKRRFKAATGYAPIDYVQALRIEEAKQLLETTAEPTDMIAHLAGYDDPAFFRRLFKRITGATPARYRQRYRYIGMAEAARV
ncbi:GlxA family transcriptional regulator [Chelativorans salis]|uniref:Helix-turn-helix domain-containing protein n=1 Tax=Chelativorans salis TaxID=2978478 RepID=A0ABT2LSS2_9HYPH|nr:helix-turn-helix domain-containing protein [Chelativorans sp. EGI FJ00035]MCT7377597.1 helix-turn-helix domain-containing protein [Chelativorans sp. EGI FJ00035]